VPGYGGDYQKNYLNPMGVNKKGVSKVMERPPPPNFRKYRGLKDGPMQPASESPVHTKASSFKPVKVLENWQSSVLSGLQISKPDLLELEKVLRTHPFSFKINANWISDGKNLAVQAVGSFEDRLLKKLWQNPAESFVICISTHDKIKDARENDSLTMSLTEAGGFLQIQAEEEVLKKARKDIEDWLKPRRRTTYKGVWKYLDYATGTVASRLAGPPKGNILVPTELPDVLDERIELIAEMRARVRDVFQPTTRQLFVKVLDLALQRIYDSKAVSAVGCDLNFLDQTTANTKAFKDSWQNELRLQAYCQSILDKAYQIELETHGVLADNLELMTRLNGGELADLSQTKADVPIVELGEIRYLKFSDGRSGVLEIFSPDGWKPVNRVEFMDETSWKVGTKVVHKDPNPGQACLHFEGEIVLCDSGHEICEFIKDWPRGERITGGIGKESPYLGKWRAGQTPAKGGDPIPLKCLCGAPYTSGMDGMGRFRIKDKEPVVYQITTIGAGGGGGSGGAYPIVSYPNRALEEEEARRPGPGL